MSARARARRCARTRFKTHKLHRTFLERYFEDLCVSPAPATPLIPGG